MIQDPRASCQAASIDRLMLSSQRDKVVNSEPSDQAMYRGNSLGQLLLTGGLAIGVSLDLAGLNGERSHGIRQACGTGER